MFFQLLSCSILNNIWLKTERDQLNPFYIAFVLPLKVEILADPYSCFGVLYPISSC